MRWLMNTQFYRWCLKHIVPYIRFSTYYTKFSGQQYAALAAALQPGDIILAVDKKKLSSMLIPGTFSHAAVCINKGVFPEVVEMTHEDYHKTMFFDVCKEADRVVILRCPAFGENYTHSFIRRAKSFEGARYDIRFDLGVKELYCSELVYQADFEERLKVQLEKLDATGSLYVSPDALYRANVVVVADSDTVVTDQSASA